MRIAPFIIAVASLAACAPYGLHRPASVMGPGQAQLAITLDLARFLPRDEERAPDVLREAALLPGLQYRRGFEGGAELDLTLYPIGLRVGGRARLAGKPEGRGALTAEAGLTVALGLAPETSQVNFRPLLIPDAALVGGWRPGDRGELYAAARYLWLRQKIAGAGFEHAPGLTAGYQHRLGGIELQAEGSAMLSPTTGDLILVPGLGVGFLPE